MSSLHFSCDEARKLDIVDYLSSLEFSPQKIRNNDYWYLSPFRTEKEPSFKVNRQLNSWFDYGIGKGGNIIDFGILYHNSTVKDLLPKLHAYLSFDRQTYFTRQPDHADERKRIHVLSTGPIVHPVLHRYLEQRKISLELANQYCKQVEYRLNGKGYFAIGFPNNAGGYELRNPYFKGSSSPKDVTMIDRGAKEIAVVEDFFSFLSYLALHEIKELGLTNFLILNSLSFFVKSRPLMEKNEAVHLYLDRDVTGRKCTANALSWDSKYADKSDLYKQHKDLNDLLVNGNRERRQSCRLRKGF